MSSLSESATLKTLLTSSAFAPIAQLGWLRVTGSDRVRWLNGMATNSIQTLKPGEGCYTFFLNAQGRIQGDAYAWMLEDAILLETDAGRLPALMAYLDRFVIMDDVELENHTMDGTGLAVFGPHAETLLKQTGFEASLSPLHFMEQLWPHENGPVPVRRLCRYSPLVSAFELWSDPATIGLVAESLRAAGAAEAAPEVLEQLRILSGIPLYGQDIRDRELPQETAQTRALHFAKGCYLGQEIVERIHSRGNVHRTFTGFTLSGTEPSPGAALSLAEAPEKPIGELTSITRIGSQLYALGYIRREALERQSPVMYDGGPALPASLPFHLDSSSL